MKYIDIKDKSLDELNKMLKEKKISILVKKKKFSESSSGFQ